MGDVITVKCVLKRGGFEGVPGTADSLSFVLEQRGPGKPDWHCISCHEAGTPEPACGHPVWKYEVREGRLHLTPSLLDTSTGFHTDFHWNVAYEECPPGIDPFTHFFAINLEAKP